MSHVQTSVAAFLLRKFQQSRNHLTSHSSEVNDQVSGSPLIAQLQPLSITDPVVSHRTSLVNSDEYSPKLHPMEPLQQQQYPSLSSQSTTNQHQYQSTPSSYPPDSTSSHWSSNAVPNSIQQPLAEPNAQTGQYQVPYPSYSEQSVDLGQSTYWPNVGDSATALTCLTEPQLQPPVDDQISLQQPSDLHLVTPTTEKALQLSHEVNGILADHVGDGSLHLPLPREASSYSSHSSLPLSVEAGGGGGGTYVSVLERRNLDLASALDKRTRAFDQCQVKVTTLQQQLIQLQAESQAELDKLKSAGQRDVKRAQEQARAQAQTIGALVAEKTELQSQVDHLTRLTDQRAREIDSLGQQLQSTRSQLLELERSMTASHSSTNELTANNSELQFQLDQTSGELKRERSLRLALKSDLDEAQTLLSANSTRTSQLESQLTGVKRQLELAQIHSKTGADVSSQHSSPIEHSSASPTSSERVVELLEKINQLESTVESGVDQCRRLQSRYDAYTSQAEQELNNLRSQLFDANTSRQKAEMERESARRDLRQRDLDLDASVRQCELLTFKLANASCPTETVSMTTPSESPVPRTKSCEVGVQTVIEDSQKIDDKEDGLFVSQLKEQLSNSQAESFELKSQVDLLTQQLTAAQSSMADYEVVAASATSHRLTMSKAVEQNKMLKSQLASLEDELNRVTTKNDQLSGQLEQERQKASRQLELDVECKRELEELRQHWRDSHSSTGTSPHPQQRSLLPLASQTSPSTTTTLLSDPATVVTLTTSSASPTVATMTGPVEADDDYVVVESQTDTVTSPDPKLLVTDKHQHHVNAQLQAALEETQSHVKSLGDRLEQADLAFNRLRALYSWLTTQLGKKPTSSTSDSDTCQLITSLDQLIQQLIADRCLAEATQQQSQLLTSQRDASRGSKVDQGDDQLPTREAWKQFKLTNQQLEAKLANCLEQLETANRRASQLESVVVKLEAEAEVANELVALFTRRRHKAIARAEVRERLLARLVRDRDELRSRVGTLLTGLVEANIKDGDTGCHDNIGDGQKDTVGGENKQVGSDDELLVAASHTPTQNTPIELHSQLTALLNDLAVSADESMVLSKSHLADEDADSDKDEMDQVSISSTRQSPTGRAPTSETQTPSPQVHHDCPPHCQCCVGDLIIV